MAMSSRDRVLAVLNHEVPDRVPIIMGVSNATGIKMKTYQGNHVFWCITIPQEDEALDHDISGDDWDDNGHNDLAQSCPKLLYNGLDRGFRLGSFNHRILLSGWQAQERDESRYFQIITY